ncbi:hypothetical protein FA10DRAFT_52992 [Acaromyces ingoldii]|uniref:Long chronological lifespan protein 2 n=1 Tax=Acaromyces ingoldii TaxID=215250 RepID=A0A316YFP7_9BASI|nr:hypothetical protein FA10DRAFT_52992 [Acaromyces ingoldii]PWN86565.1 hypothetical protein FA10DRAFT_52992 [Acaromyces ingoldii]
MMLRSNVTLRFLGVLLAVATMTAGSLVPRAGLKVPKQGAEEVTPNYEVLRRFERFNGPRLVKRNDPPCRTIGCDDEQQKKCPGHCNPICPHDLICRDKYDDVDVLYESHKAKKKEESQTRTDIHGELKWPPVASRPSSPQREPIKEEGSSVKLGSDEEEGSSLWLESDEEKGSSP